MSLSSLTNKVIFNGNGSATVFPYTFPILLASHLSVIYTDAAGVESVLSSSVYSVTGIGGVNGGNVTYLPATGGPIATGTKLTILRTVPLTQTTVLSNQGGYYPEVVEARFDQVYMALQQFQDELTRSLVVPVSDSAAPGEVPSATARANSVLGFDADGDPYAATGLGTTAVSTWLATNFMPQTSAAAALEALEGVSANINLVPNSDLGICTSLILRRVGTAVSVTAWTTAGGPTGMGQFTTATAAAAGLTDGKLCLLEGPATPHVPIVAVAGTATSTRRITCAAGTFTGVAQGDTCWLTGGSNTSPKGQYRISATNGDTYIELFGYSASMLVNEVATYSMTFTQGGYPSAVDATINGIPQAGDPVLTSAVGYPLKVASATGASTVYATLAGATLSALNTATANMWEVTPGDDFGVTGDAADGWKKTPTLKYYRSYDKDWDGTTAVTLSGSLYGCKVIKGVASVEDLSTNLAAANATQRDTTDPRKLAHFKGKTITFGMYWKPPSASKARPFINDGVTTTYGSYYSAGSLNWVEIEATISTSATYVLVGIAIEGSIDDIHYGTQPMAISGRVIGAGNYQPTRGKHQFASHPNMPLYVNGPIPAARIIRLEQESFGQLPRGLSSIDIGVEGHCNQPGGNTSLDTAALLVSDSPTTYIPSLTLYQPQERSSLFCSSDTTTVAAGATTYIGQRTLNATEALAASFMPFYPSGAVALAMYCKCTAAPVGAETFTYTLFKNGVATSIAVVITGAAVAGSYIALGANLANQVTYAPGDSFSVRVVASGGAAVTTHRIAIEVNRISDDHAVNSGLAVVGKYTEYLGLPSDIMYVAPGFAINTGWLGVNIDMFGCHI